MLVNCPRCGFSQPKDKYCAQCGVDTETFKAPQESAFKKYLTSPALFLGIAIVALVVVFKSSHNGESSSLSQRVKFLKGSLQIANHTGDAKPKPADTAAGPQRDIAAVSEEAAPITPAASDAASTTAALGAAAPAPAAAMTTSTANPSSAAQPTGPLAKGVSHGEEPSVLVYYAEVPRRAYEKIQEESQATGQFNTFGDYTAGILPDIEKRIHSEAMKIQVFEKAQELIGKDQRFFTGMHDPELDEDVGLTTLIELADTENNTFRGNIEIVRSLREFSDSNTGSSAQKTSYPAIFEMAPGSGFFIAGVLPHKARLAHEDVLARKGAFQILKSPQFQNNESQFVIFIEFRKKP